MNEALIQRLALALGEFNQAAKLLRSNGVDIKLLAGPTNTCNSMWANDEVTALVTPAPIKVSPIAPTP